MLSALVPRNTVCRYVRSSLFISTSTFWLGLAIMISVNWLQFIMSTSSTFRITSSGKRPALSAGPSGITASIVGLIVGIKGLNPKPGINAFGAVSSLVLPVTSSVACFRLPNLSVAVILICSSSKISPRIEIKEACQV